jgi:hypothetical protein
MDVAKLASGLDQAILGRCGTTYDVATLATLLASLDSAQYYTDHLLHAKARADRFDLLGYAMSLQRVDGVVLEFGVASGATLNYLAECTADMIFGFDSFDGLPETRRPGIEVGAFAQAPPAVLPNVELIIGAFSSTVQQYSERLGDHAISLMHIDCDLYSSTETVLRGLSKNIVSGTVIVFDEYFNYPGWRHHEFKAFQEFVSSNRMRYRYEALVPTHQQVCVVIE